LSEPNDTALTKLKLARSYLKLVSTPFDQSGARSVLLERHGDYEVRLVEFSTSRAAHTALLWIELYDTRQEISVDSSECLDLGDAALATAHAIAQAKNLANDDNP